MTPQTEVELKFRIPDAARKALVAEMARAPATRTLLQAMYLDTADRRLAKQDMAWRLRREGRRWIQTLKGGGSGALERFEHEVVRPDASHDASGHAGTLLGDALIALLRRAQEDGVEAEVRFRTQIRRTARRIRTRGAVVEVAFDEGRLLAGESALPVREVEFELVSGSVAAMLVLAQRWRKRFGLVYEPRSKAERGDRLADGLPHAALRKAQQASYGGPAIASDAFGAVVDECLAHITRNATGLTDGEPAARVEHVHQLRVGIRRLRSALRSFDGWVPAAPDELVAGLRALFATLGQSRDSDVLDSGVVAALAKVRGAPPLPLPAGAAGPDPAALVTADDAQRTFLDWIAWRADFSHVAHSAGGTDIEPADAKTFRRDAERRLRRWHARIAAEGNVFDELDDTRLHALRKRIKRQRYAVEFFLPVLRPRKTARYLKALAAVQERMGELNDLMVARDRYQALLASDPAAWFALGWLAARIAEVRTFAKAELGQLAQAEPPRA